MEALLPIITQLVGGAVGGNVGGAAMSNSSLGTVGNSVAGALGGLGGASVIGPLLGLASTGGFSLSSLAASGVGGLVLQVIVGLIKSKMA